MEILKTIPDQTIPPDLWKALFTILGCVFLYLVGHLVSWLKKTIITYDTEIKKLLIDNEVTKTNVVNLDRRVQSVEHIATVKYREQIKIN